MVAGGIGQTPFVALAKEALGQQTYGSPPRHVPAVDRVTLCYGARSADYFAGMADFAAVGVEVHVSTDDGIAWIARASDRSARRRFATVGWGGLPRCLLWT